MEITDRDRDGKTSLSRCHFCNVYPGQHHALKCPLRSDQDAQIKSWAETQGDDQAGAENEAPGAQEEAQ